MGSGGGDTNTIQSTEPPAYQKPYLEDIARRAAQLYASHTPSMYPGRMVAPWNADQQAAIDNLRGVAQSIAPATEATVANNLFLQRDVLSPDTNPHLRQYGAALAGDITKNFQQDILPSLRLGSAIDNSLSGSRAAIAEGQAAGDATDAVARSLSQLYTGAYDSGLDAAAKAGAIAPMVQQGAALPAQLRGMAGDATSAYEQALINEQINRHNFEQQLPYAKLATFRNLISGEMGGVTTTESNLPATNPIMAGAGGAAMGLSINSMLPAGVAVEPYTAAAVGAMMMIAGTR